ncbi:Paraneoplastic antigen-like protein 5 [Mizuhopecten yessoensis]|uniref:Paraneoplastic antigen-like protein 5 n=1 Tax=Mizuhopecten yessoensis TaxID=6573 RepID=A0A210R117_MIZYE|nr:Paraneoplastic antigen-like protein 5 [Mizuhopecten yessoensis]
MFYVSMLYVYMFPLVLFLSCSFNIIILPTTMAEFTEEEIGKLVSSFKELGVKPKADSASDLKDWMEQFTKSAVVSSGHKEAVHLTHKPRISPFSGEGGKGEASFDLWRYEVECLQEEKSYSEDIIKQAIRNSLRGTAVRIAMRLGSKASVEELMRKLKSVYGPVEVTETLMANFYGARQKESEDVSTWACRIEDLLMKVYEHTPLGAKEINRMLRNVFYTGLRQEMKDITGHKYDAIDDYDKLLIAVRQVEKDHNRDKEIPDKTKQATGTSKMAATSPETNQIQQMYAVVNQLSTDFKSFKADAEKGAKDLKKRQQDWEKRNKRQGYRHSNNDRSDWSQDYRQDQGKEQGFRQDRGKDQGNRGPVCWRCGQYGHIRRDCRVIMDHSRRDLNL